MKDFFVSWLITIVIVSVCFIVFTGEIEWTTVLIGTFISTAAARLTLVLVKG